MSAADLHLPHRSDLAMYPGNGVRPGPGDGVRPGESDPVAMLGWVLLLVAVTALTAIFALAWWLV